MARTKVAVALACLNLIIPVRRIAAVWPGGFAAFWREHGDTPRLWHDGRLLRDGAMNRIDLELTMGFWQRRGLRRRGADAAGGRHVPGTHRQRADGPGLRLAGTGCKWDPRAPA